MNKGMAGYYLAFAVLIITALFMGNHDQITPTVAKAEAEMSIGAGPVQVIKKGTSLLLTLIGGATFTGVVAVVFREGTKIYKAWMRDSRLKRWTPGPNAQWRQQSTPTPRLKREDLMLLALMGGNMRQQPRINSQLGSMRNTSSDDDGINLEF